MSRARASATNLILIGIALSRVACGDAAATAPSGEQIASGRDFDNVFFWHASTLGFTRQAMTPGIADQDLWVWPDGEAAPQLALANIDWTRASSARRFRIGDVLLTGSFGQRIYDLQARASVDLNVLAATTSDGQVIPSPPPPIDYSAVRPDGGAVLAYSGWNLQLLVGRVPDLGRIGPLAVKAVDFLGTDLALLGHPGTHAEDPDGLYRIGLPSGELTPLPVAPFAPSPSRCPQSPCFSFAVLGCSDDTAPCPGTDRPPCAIFYLRPASDGSGAMQPYAFDVASSTEAALPGADVTRFSTSPDRHRVAWTNSELDPQATLGIKDATDVFVRDVCTGEEHQCPMARPLRLAWRADSGALAVDLASDRLGLVTVPSGPCVAVGEGTAADISLRRLFSFDGKQLASLAPGLQGDANTLWLSDGLGNGQRLLATGSIASFFFTLDGERMLVTRTVADGLSLSWIDLTTEHPIERAIAPMANRFTANVSQRVLVIDNWNEQDLTGTLELIDLTSGDRQVLARAVADFATASSVDEAARIVYAVHGRYASGRDGLWQLTLPPR